jgi:CubicO group peptidase (beta-lactamase class C family)
MRKTLILLLLPSLLVAQTDSTDFIVKRFMDEQKIVGLSLAVIKSGRPTVNKGYGFGNIELKVPVTAGTVMKLGSLSKQFLATAIMTLVEDGKLGLEDPVHKFFPDAPETWRPIRIKNLLSHTSGLRRESPGYDIFKIQPDLDVIKAAYNLPLDFKTGEKYQYCNLAYFMLAEIIKQVSGTPWQVFIQKRLFAPAGMNDSQMTDFYGIIANRANGYMHRHDTLVNFLPVLGIRPSGGFQSTSSDMIKWEKIIAEKKMILKKENWEKLWQPFIRMTNEASATAYYGFGWAMDEYKGHKIIIHGGSLGGFKSVYMRFVNDGVSIVILTNTDEANPHAIGFALADHYFRK